MHPLAQHKAPVRERTFVPKRALRGKRGDRGEELSCSDIQLSRNLRESSLCCRNAAVFSILGAKTLHEARERGNTLPCIGIHAETLLDFRFGTLAELSELFSCRMSLPEAFLITGGTNVAIGVLHGPLRASEDLINVGFCHFLLSRPIRPQARKQRCDGR